MIETGTDPQLSDHANDAGAEANVSGGMLALLAFMNLALYLMMRAWIVPHLVWGKPYFISLYLFSFAFQLNWVMLMVGALYEYSQSSNRKMIE